MAKILIVDDDPRLLESLSLLFEANRYAVTTATCGNDALSVPQLGSFDLAILDLHLPDMPGTRIMDGLKDCCPDIPIVFITGDEGVDLALAALKKGAYAYLRKPFEFEELLKTVEHALYQKALLAEQKDLYRKLHLTEKKARTANRFLVIGNRHTEMSPLLEAFVEELRSSSGCSAAAVRIIGEDGGIPYAHSTGFGGDFCYHKEPLSIHSEKGMCARVIKNQTASHPSCFTAYGSYYVKSASAFLASASEDQTRLMRNTCHQFGYETVALIPIRSGGATIGLIHLADREENRLADHTIDILEAAALQLGTALERVLAQQALKDAFAKLEKKVEERTRMLSQARDDLIHEIERRRQYEKELLDFQQRLRELSSRLIQTEARERRRIATEIHDRIGQTLAVIKMQLGAVKAAFDIPDLTSRLETIRQMVSQTIADVRTLTFELSPPILHTLGLKAAVDWLAETVRKQSGLAIDVTIDGSDAALDADSRGMVFRICSELLLNVVKHADANAARVAIDIKDDSIAATISDDGVGFDPVDWQDGRDPSERGFGLFSIKEQLRYHGGRFQVASHPNQGSAVTINLPLSVTGQAAGEEAS